MELDKILERASYITYRIFREYENYSGLIQIICTDTDTPLEPYFLNNHKNPVFCLVKEMYSEGKESLKKEFPTLAEEALHYSLIPILTYFMCIYCPRNVFIYGNRFAKKAERDVSFSCNRPIARFIADNCGHGIETSGDSELLNESFFPDFWKFESNLRVKNELNIPDEILI